MTRLCVVSPFQHGGGAEYQIDLLLAALVRTGRFQVFHLVHHVDNEAHPDGYRVLRIGHSSRMPLFGYVMDLWPLYRSLAQISPQIIYQRVACGYTGICALYARRHDARFIWHVAHDTDVMRQSLDSGRNFLRRSLEKRSIEYGLRRADRIVVQTQQQNELLSQHYGRVADELIPNFSAPPSRPNEKSAPPLVVWIANLKPWKRPEVFVRLALALRNISDAQFIMLGEAPSGIKGAGWYQSLLRSITTTPNLKYLGRRDHNAVNEVLARACIFVNTSVHEGFPNTFIQAWMRDAVVVSLDVNPDRVLDRQGVGIHAGSEENLARQVTRLLTEPESRVPYIERAREYARATHSLRNIDMLVRMIDDCAHTLRQDAGTSGRHYRIRPSS